MCTLISVNKKFWREGNGLVISRMRLDGRGNDDGWSLVCMDPANNHNDMHVQTMNLMIVIEMAKAFMGATDNDEARLWLHARAATGVNVGINYCHGFTDYAGQFIMHNGILRSKMAVDSYQLACTYSQIPEEMLQELQEDRESFANIFLINEYEYSVIRVQGGVLHTDDEGNFSSHPIGAIKIPVMPGYCESFQFETKPVVVTGYSGYGSWGGGGNRCYPQSKAGYPAKVTATATGFRQNVYGFEDELDSMDWDRRASLPPATAEVKYFDDADETKATDRIHEKPLSSDVLPLDGDLTEAQIDAIVAKYTA